MGGLLPSGQHTPGACADRARQTAHTALQWQCRPGSALQSLHCAAQGTWVARVAAWLCCLAEQVVTHLIQRRHRLAACFAAEVQHALDDMGLLLIQRATHAGRLPDHSSSSSRRRHMHVNARLGTTHWRRSQSPALAVMLKTAVRPPPLLPPPRGRVVSMAPAACVRACGQPVLHPAWLTRPSSSCSAAASEPGLVDTPTSPLAAALLSLHPDPQRLLCHS